MPENNSTKLIPAVFYGRCSTLKQETSVEDQRKAVYAYAAKHGYKIVRDYVDEGISGDATEQRPGFLKMHADACRRDRGFDAILVYNDSRFGRFDSLEAGYYIHPMRKNGVYLVTTDKGVVDWDSPTGRVMHTINSDGANKFLIDLSHLTLGRMIQRAQEGFWLGGAPPYGYKVVDSTVWVGSRSKKRRVLVPDEPHKVEVLRWIFQTYAEKDVSLRWLAEELYRRGTASPRGHKHWTSETIRAMLARREYIGDCDWGRIHHGGKHGIENGEVKAKGRKVMNGKGTRPKRIRVKPEDMIVVQQPHLALIDRDVWEAVQAKLAANQKRTTPMRAGGDWLLSGLLTCGHCGAHLMGYSNVNHSRRDAHVFRKYKCSGYAHYGKSYCHHHAVNEKPLLDVLIRKLQEEVLNPDNLQAERDEIERQEREAAEEKPAETARLSSRIAALDQNIAKGNRNMALADPDALPGIAAAVREWRAERDRLDKTLKASESGRGPPRA